MFSFGLNIKTDAMFSVLEVRIFPITTRNFTKDTARQEHSPVCVH